MDKTEQQVDEMHRMMSNPLFPMAMREWIGQAPIDIIADIIRFSSAILYKRVSKEGKSDDFKKGIMG